MKKWKVVIIIVALLVVGGCTAVMVAGVASTTSTTTSSNSAKITLDKFNQLESGMTYEQVKAIIGGDGELAGESGKKGDAIHIVSYKYKGSGITGANASLMFQDEKLVNKAQAGLK